MSLRNYNLLVQLIEEYRRRLSNYNEESFFKKIKEDVWSPAEVYAHIISANRLTVRGMHRASEGNATLDNSSLSFNTRLIFLLGRIPRGRKVPEVVQKRTVQFNSIQEAKEGVDSLLKELEEVWKTNSTWRDDQKLKHPALGLLNNNQWIVFMKIHSRHHLKQLDRVSGWWLVTSDW